MIQDFPDAKDPSSSELFTLDLAVRLIDAETIVTATSAMFQLSGPTDADTSAMISGSTLIEDSRVSQMITGGVDGNEYIWVLTVTTSLGQTFPVRSRIKVSVC